MSWIFMEDRETRRLLILDCLSSVRHFSFYPLDSKGIDLCVFSFSLEVCQLVARGLYLVVSKIFDDGAVARASEKNKKRSSGCGAAQDVFFLLFFFSWWRSQPSGSLAF